MDTAAIINKTDSHFLLRTDSQRQTKNIQLNSHFTQNENDMELQQVFEGLVNELQQHTKQYKDKSIKYVGNDAILTYWTRQWGLQCVTPIDIINRVHDFLNSWMKCDSFNPILLSTGSTISSS